MAVRDRDALPPRRTCGTMSVHMMLLEQHPAIRARRFRLEEQTIRMCEIGGGRAARGIVTVKTVVHVVYHPASQRVGDAQIERQIEILNRDFTATNRDRGRIPAPWRGLVRDAQIRFQLADVTRTRTARPSFGPDDGMKRSSSGGIPPYRPKTHLNLWVCALEGGLLGYAQFPCGPSATDGVVIHYRAFGTRGTARPPFDRGRTATHEVGHYFNLRHVWGDTEDCRGSDAIADTPNAAGPNFGRPSFPTVSCRNGPHGDMFMNFMDYVDDAAMCMFTAQQVARMRATLAGPRSGL